MSVRVRFAPSPTGYLHIGGARTALFNWLLARKAGGVFILRIEDTDLERSSREMVEGILQGLTWLGLDWDEGPVHQSQRLELYREAARRLLHEGKAYPCFCGTERDDQNWQYPGTCRNLAPREASRKIEQGLPRALRFKVPRDRHVRFDDRVFGSIEVHTREIGDFIIMRADNTPTYHLSVVTDDIEMNISQVVRGADHLSNTSKHILLFQALDAPRPEFAHLPLILGPDRKRLSKRHGATSILECRDQGFLPQALRNYLALLGWAPAGGDRELFSDRELTQAFDLDRVSKSNAVFDPQKLEWMNGQYISQTEPEVLWPAVERELRRAGLWGERSDPESVCSALEAIDLLKGRVRRTGDFARLWGSFFSDTFDYEEEALDKLLSPSPEEKPALEGALEDLRDAYRELSPFDLESSEQVLREVAERHSLKAGKLMGAVRVALTGKSVAPGLFEIIAILGRPRTLDRLARVLEFLR